MGGTAGRTATAVGEMRRAEARGQRPPELGEEQVFDLEPRLQRLRFEERTLVRLAAGEDPNDPAWARGGVATLA